MEAAYMALNPRLEELTKSVSLALLDPLALERLRSTGKCSFTLPEAIFDLDHPGHYFRRIKTLAVNVPCVAGPQVGVTARVTMVANRYRANTELKEGCYCAQPNDSRFVANRGGIASISTSTAMNDSGLFEVALGDERYLPFEGAGVESSWTVELQHTLPTFDATTISDIILTIRYTAKHGGAPSARWWRIRWSIRSRRWQSRRRGPACSSRSTCAATCPPNGTSSRPPGRSIF